MKPSIKNIFFFAFLVFLCSCGRDHFSSVLEVELPENESILAVTSQISAGDEAISALVSQTLGALEKPEFATFPDASVQLFENGTLLNQLKYDEFIEKHFSLLDIPINDIEGTVYRMEVTASNFETVFAEQIMPTKVPVIDAKYTPLGTIDFEGNEQDELIVEWQDPANEEHFYSITAFVEIKFKFDGDTTTQVVSDRLYLDSLDPLIEYGGDNERLLNDRTFDGNTYKARLFFYPFHNWIGGEELEIISSNIVVQLGTITNDKYLYLKTLDAFRENRDNPFSEPVTVHHNFENGTGIFTVENSSSFLIEL